MKISFIIIGRNEGWKLTNCLKSVFNTITYNKLDNYEIIYVDSKSTDNSIESVKQFKNVKIFQLTIDYNAAIARNVGANKSKGQVLFFIDGDMEIIPEFLQLVYSSTKGLFHPFVSGNWVNFFYDTNNKIIRREKFLKEHNDTIEKVTGGLFLIQKKTWLQVGGMKPIFKKSQDVDLGLRLAKKSIFLLRKKEIAAIHHTIAYLDKNRTWKELSKHLYGRSLLYRNHLFNRYAFKRFIRNEYSLYVSIICVLISLATGFYYFILFYFFVVLIRNGFKINKTYFFLIVRDLTVFSGFFCFIPKKKFNINVKEVS